MEDNDGDFIKLNEKALNADTLEESIDIYKKIVLKSQTDKNFYKTLDFNIFLGKYHYFFII